MESDHAAIANSRALLKLPGEPGPGFAEEWATVRRQVEVVSDALVSHDTEPAGAPRLDVPQ